MENNENKHEILGEAAASGNQAVVIENDLSIGEKKAVLARINKVASCFERLGIADQKDHQRKPVIAVMGSGGGLRAMVGLLGSLRELSNQGFLDAITYLCGTSGSTWCMASLYNYENWSQNMEKIEKKMWDGLTKTKRNWPKTWEKLMQTSKDNTQSLTDFWAYVVVQMITNEINENKLSSHQVSCENGNDPYPVYSAVEKRLVEANKLNDPGAWFEFTPHRSGFPAYKCFVDTPLLGSQFSEGKLLKSMPESDLCYLQGLWGSALANKEMLSETIKDFMRKSFHMSSCANILENQDIKDFTCGDITCKCKGCIVLQKLMSAEHWKIYDLEEDQRICTLTQAIEELMQGESEIPEVHGKTREDFDIDALQNMFYNVPGLCEISKVTYQAWISLTKWEWGTTNNFLFNWNGPGDIPQELSTQKYLFLIDAGLVINSAYPLMLPPHRKVDLFLSFDFSAGDPFMTLKSTADYCQKNKIPFPKIQIDRAEEECPSENCYIFEEKEDGFPIVMHFPLFNNRNCKGAVNEWKDKYPTLKLSYEESELENLFEVSKMNVKLSSDHILKKFQYVNNRM